MFKGARFARALGIVLSGMVCVSFLIRNQADLARFNVAHDVESQSIEALGLVSGKAAIDDLSLPFGTSRASKTHWLAFELKRLGVEVAATKGSDVYNRGGYLYFSVNDSLRGDPDLDFIVQPKFKGIGSHVFASGKPKVENGSLRIFTVQNDVGYVLGGEGFYPCLENFCVAFGPFSVETFGPKRSKLHISLESFQPPKGATLRITLDGLTIMSAPGQETKLSVEVPSGYHVVKIWPSWASQNPNSFGIKSDYQNVVAIINRVERQNK